MPKKKIGDPRWCAHCATVLDRKRFNGRLEDFGVFNRRKFCDQNCMAKAMMQDDPSRKGYAIRAGKYRKPTCEHCGTAQALTVHHKDRNWRNNDPMNLQTLCNSCHTSLHHAEGGTFATKADKPPCSSCGKPSYRGGYCNTCRSRVRRAALRSQLLSSCVDQRFSPEEKRYA